MHVKNLLEILHERVHYLGNVTCVQMIHVDHLSGFLMAKNEFFFFSRLNYVRNSTAEKLKPLGCHECVNMLI